MSETYIPESFHNTSQKDISQAVDLFIHQQQLAASLQEDLDKARLNLLGVQGAGAWLNAVPSKALGLYLGTGTRELLAAHKYILGSLSTLGRAPVRPVALPVTDSGIIPWGVPTKGRGCTVTTLRDLINRKIPVLSVKVMEFHGT